MEVDATARRLNQRRLRDLSLHHGEEVRMFCGHDPVEFAILSEGARERS